MELLQLKYFCDAAESENFSETARKYLVPTSNISQSIKRLESELGRELFEHRANKIYLNSEGKQFYDGVSQALSLLEDARARVSETGEELQGDIDLVCLNNRRMVTSAIETFIVEHPKVNFIIHHTPKQNQSFDIVISDVCPYEYGERILLVDEEICVAMRRDHRLAEREELSLSDLSGERFITMPEGASIQKVMMNTCAEAGFVPNIAIQTDDPFYLRKYVEMGLGITFVPSDSWRGLFSDITVLKSIGNIRRRTYAYLPQKKYKRRAVQMFLDTLKGN